MLLSPDQEQELLEKNMPKIYRAVDNFMAKCSMETVNIPYDDFVQEVSIAFIQYVRRCKTLDKTNIFPWYSAMGAMRDLVLSYQPMSCPKSSHRFSEIIHNMPRTVSIDALSASSGLEIDGMSKHWVDDKETQIDFDIFMSDQPENTRRIASMRVYGMTHKEIANQCGTTQEAIRKRLKRLSNSYMKSQEEANDE